MKKSVDITIKSKISGENGNDEISYTASGEYFVKGEVHYLSYTEPQRDGFSNVKTTVKISIGEVSLIRFGETQTNFKFVQGETLPGVYKTPYGAMPVKISAEKVGLDINEAGGKIFLLYNLEIAEMKSQNILNLTFDIK